MCDDEFRDQPICDDEVTDYDRARLRIYVRLLDAAAAGADWREAAVAILGLNVEAGAARAERIHAVHLDRARWMAAHGFRALRSK